MYQTVILAGFPPFSDFFISVQRGLDQSEVKKIKE